MARLLFLTTLLAAAVVYAAAEGEDTNKALAKTLTIAHSCDKKCNSCYPRVVGFTPGDCQKEGDFSYKATCKDNNGGWTLTTFRGDACDDASKVYSFDGEQDTCRTSDKYTNAQISSIEADSVKLTLCPFKDNDKCTDEGTTKVCITQTVKTNTECVQASGQDEDQKYYYRVKVNGGNSDKNVSLAVYSTKTECTHGALPLTRLLEKKANECVHYQHSVQGVCEDVPREATLSVLHSCDKTCTQCYPKPSGFTIAAECQKKDGEDFSYKATCNAEGAWTLTTYRDNACGDDNKVYSFEGTDGNEGKCAANNKHTNVKVSSIDNTSVKLTLCPMKADNMCLEEDTQDKDGCVVQTVTLTNGKGDCVEGTGANGGKKYYYAVEVIEEKTKKEEPVAEQPAGAGSAGSKKMKIQQDEEKKPQEGETKKFVNLAVFSTKTQCTNKVLPLTRLLKAASKTCLSYQQHVQVLCEKGVETTTTSTSTSTSKDTAGSDSDSNSDSAQTTSTTDDNSTANTTGDGVAGVASLVAASVTAAAIAMLF